VFEGPTDDTYEVSAVNWGETGTYEIVHQDDDSHYVLEFRSVTVVFPDPDPLRSDADIDSDGLDERREFQISAQDLAVQPIAITGYDGLADPGWRDVFVEIDAVGADNRVPYDGKQMMVSQFRYQNMSLRIDATEDSGANGYLGGGQALPYEETLTLDKLDSSTYKGDNSRFAPERTGHFRYGLFSDRVEGEGSFGVGSFTPARGFIVAHLRLIGIDLGHAMIAQYTPILMMHETGHTFGLCHRAGDRGETAPASCPAPAGDRCRHYCDISNTEFVDQSSTTAMGSDTTFDLITEIVGQGTLAGIGAGIVVGGLIGFAIGGPLGGHWRRNRRRGGRLARQHFRSHSGRHLRAFRGLSLDRVGRTTVLVGHCGRIGHRCCRSVRTSFHALPCRGLYAPAPRRRTRR
jgi:hypothetical protein